MKRRVLLSLPPTLLLPSAALAALPATPSQSTGPFYPAEPPRDDDNDLVQVLGHSEPARGTILHLGGQVRRRDGSVVEGALVEIWQCDSNGRYHHPGDRRAIARDEGFQGYGRHVTAAPGEYRFRTIRPVAYPGRTPHIHFAVTAPGERPLVTQMYVRGEAGNAGDFLYRRIPHDERDRLTVALEPHGADAAALSGRFDIVLPV